MEEARVLLVLIAWFWIISWSTALSDSSSFSKATICRLHLEAKSPASS